MKKILILGSSGYLGYSLVKFLSDFKDLYVVGYQRKKFSNNFLYRIICGDFLSEDWDVFFQKNKFDVVIHLISSSTPSTNISFAANELSGVVLSTVKLINALRDTDIKFIFASSGGTVYGDNHKLPIKEDSRLDPICGYGLHKVLIENYCRLYDRFYGLDYKIMRIANPYGGGGQARNTQGIIPILVRKLFANEPIEIYGNTVRDYLYLDDLLLAFLKLIDDTQNKYRVFNIGTGVGTHTFDLIKLIETFTDRTFNNIKNTDLRVCDVSYNVLDISLAQEVLKWSPRISLSVGLQKYIETL